MAKKSEPKIKRMRYRDALSKATIRLGSRDVGFDERGMAVMDSGSVSYRDDFRSIREQLEDGDIDLLGLTALAQNYEQHPKKFVRYEG